MNCAAGRRLLVKGAIWLVFLQGTSLAYVTDNQSYTPINYFIFLPPDVGRTSLDPGFGTAITRVSDARSTPNAADIGMLTQIVNEYSTMTPFNADNSRMLVQHQSYFALYDDAGHYLRDLPFEITAASEPRWSRQDPNVLYYVTGNRLKRYDTATATLAPVHAFSEYSVVNGRGESDICFDGDHFVLVGDHQNIFVYEISTDTKGPVLATTELGGFDNVYITPDDHVLVSWYASGIGRYKGVELFDRGLNFLRQVSPAIGHMDVTRDVSGDEVLLLANAAVPNPPPGCENAVVKIRLADGQQTCLISFHWSLAFNVSASDNGGWVVISTYAPSDPSPLAGWARYANEILQVKLDGSQVRRLAHHRSRPFNSYSWTPRASVSRDGTRLLFSSNYGLPAILGYPGEYSDVYLIDLSSARPSSGGSQMPVGLRVEQNDATASYNCPPYATWYTHTLSVHSGGSTALAVTPGCQATFTFSGTGVRWIGYRDEWSGIANVYVDGRLEALVDTFAAPAQSQAVLFSKTGLPMGTHTLVVEVSGDRNPLSSGFWIWVDAFEVVVRYEQDAAPAVYTCSPYATWYTNMLPLHSGGSAALALDPECRVSFSFTGTAVSWIGYRDAWAGIARVSLDGAVRAEIDTYASLDRAQAVLYTITGLAPGPHSLTIEPSGVRNPAAGGAWVWVDAFEIVP